jgi:hypothetical protein
VTTGLYLYCLREAVATRPETNPAASEIKAAAVDGNHRVFVRVFEGVEAVVSGLSLDDFGEMQKKAREDVHWIKEKALAHEMVVEEAMGKPANRPAPVIPVKFGVIFNTDERLADTLNRQSTAIRTAFDRIRGKQEWSLKLFLEDAQKFKEQVKEQNDTMRQRSKELAALPAGMAYFMEQELDEDLERECSRKLDEEGVRTFEQFRPFAAEAARVKLLDGKLTGRRERMVLNSACLVANLHLPQFERAVSEMRGKFAAQGFLLEQGGPWPAYHFTEFAHD